MNKTLDVYLHHDLVGYLTQNEHGQISFTYAKPWIENSSAVPLSQSLPLRKERFSFKECRGFFAGILPEEAKREQVARIFGISARNDFAMLDKIGGECAGAVTFVPSGVGLQTQRGHYRDITKEQLAEVLRTLPKRPLMAGEEGVRLSLAGAQDKIAVHVQNDQISIPLDGAPSTHILKPAIERFSGVVFNEAFCMRLAALIGIPTAKVSIGNTENIDFLLVERYDRRVRQTANSEAKLERLHQEDFCQALGVPSELKYQSEGGPSLKQCFALLRDVSNAPVIDLQYLLDATIFNFLIGNHDAHAKNFSLLYDQGTRFAPLYDLICTVYYPELSKKMAMKIGGEYHSDKVSPIHLEKLAEESGLAKPMVKSRVVEVSQNILANLSDVESDNQTANEVAKVIESRCKLSLVRFK